MAELTNRSISIRFLVTLAVVLLLSASVLNYWFYHQEKKQITLSMEREFNEKINSISSQASYYIIHFEHELIVELGKSAMGDEKVKYLLIRDELGTPFYKEGDFQNHEVQLISKELTYNSKPIGYVELAIDLRQYNQELNRSFWFTISSVIFTVFLLGGTVFVFFRTQVLSEMQRAKQENAAKSEFLSSMSHELRTPMNAILGFGQLLEVQIQDEEQKSSVREIIKAGDHLLILINEILDLSKIEAGKLELSLENSSLSSILDECLSLTKPLAAERDVHVINNISSTDNYIVHVDPTRFKQVMLNLLSNAIKYNNDNGTVTLSCDIVDKNHLRVSVSDTGNGLTEQQQQCLFKPFERMKEHKEIEGTGIGLVIIKRLVEMMSGVIGVESQPGEGSTFWVQVKLSDIIKHQPLLTDPR